MTKTVQKRTLETRSRLIGAANDLMSQGGFEALRVEEVVLRAGVAKGTFFAHFKDKDALMDLLIGERIDGFLDQIEAQPTPQNVAQMAETLMPLLEFMACERYVFDVILRRSGAAAVEEIGAIAMTFGRQAEVVSAWPSGGSFRKDLSPELMADGIQAFLVQAIALEFCALHSGQGLGDRFKSYLQAWLVPVFSQSAER